MEIRFTDIHDIECGGLRCDPLSMYLTNSECGDCPVIALGKAFLKIEFEL